MKLHFVLTALTISTLIIACGKKDDDKKDYLKDVNCTGIDAAENTYTAAIKPILNNSCALGGCHDAATKVSDVDLSDYAAAREAFEKKAVLCSINHGNECSRMPKGGAKLPDDVIRKLSCWAKNGYAE